MSKKDYVLIAGVLRRAYDNSVYCNNQQLQEYAQQSLPICEFN